LLLLAAAIATTAGCGSGAKSGSGSLDPKVASAYVDAEAHALCLVQSNAYPTLAALHAAYVRAESTAKLSPQGLAQARAAAASDPSLRARISTRVAATCGRHH
jgi:hypothetical protein